VHHAVNHGLGGSVRTGLAEARGDLVLYCDADMPFDMHELGKALRLLRAYEADIVSAYRFHRMGEGVRRILYSSIYNALVRTVLRLRIRDVNFAFKLLRREVVEQLELRSEGSFIDAELLAKAQRHGFHIIQFGVDYFPRARGTSTLSSSAVIIQILRELAFLLPSVYRVKPRPGDRAGAHDPTPYRERRRLRADRGHLARHRAGASRGHRHLDVCARGRPCLRPHRRVARRRARARRRRTPGRSGRGPATALGP